MHEIGSTAPAREAFNLALDAPGLDALPPTEDELPSDDGIPMETGRHRQQMELLIETLNLHWAGRQDFYVAGNMFVYFSPDQVKTHDYRGPDVFVALNVSPRERKSWVCWQEGKAPDVVIELLSESTAEFDKEEKKLIYQDRLRAPEYFWYGPFTGELVGFTLVDGVYEPITPAADGSLFSPRLGLCLQRWEGSYYETTTQWLRWITLEGEFLPTGVEQLATQRQQTEAERQRATQAQHLAEAERQRATQAQQLAEAERQRATQAEQQALDLAALLARYQEQFGALPE